MSEPKLFTLWCKLCTKTVVGVKVPNDWFVCSGCRLEQNRSARKYREEFDHNLEGRKR